ncbi:MAG: hypothetical protein BroJett018_00110 [Chloroflexota bacterium]|nr:hypothetical protein [Chloroflexota bacterium]NOG63357.1 tetratricopeptide repeat protein [Chloroflexota bacterium]GIK62217.1 MAG: hypothetical protein BroJett018_00110 [Chloroflexota bacterium]
MTISDTQHPVYVMIDKIWNHIQRSLLEGNFDYEASVGMLTQHLEVARDLQHPLLEGRIYSWLALIELELDHFEAAQAYYQDALKIFEQLGDQARIGAMINNLGETYRRTNRHLEAAECYVRTQQVGRMQGDLRMEILATTNEGLSRVALGELDRAEELFKRSIELAWDSNNDDYIRSAVGEAHQGLAEIALKQQKYPLAWQSINEALRIHTERTRLQHVASTYLVMAQLAAADPSAGKDPAELFRLSREYAEKIKSPARITRVLITEGNYWRNQKDRDHALACYQEAIQLIEQNHLAEDVEFLRQRIQELSNE